MHRMILFVAVCVCLPSVAAAQARRPMTIEDMFRVQRVADPQISPDGNLVVYVLTTVDLEGNKTSSNLWLADGKSAPRPLTTTTRKDRHPRWSPDGKHILFESNRSGENQLWVIQPDGGEARMLTTIASEASNAVWSPDGKWLAFVSAVWPEYSTKPFAESNAANKKRKEEAEKNPVKARVFTRLFYRHWDEYVDDKRQHLFVMPWNEGKGGEPRDVTPGDRDAYPTSTTFSIGDDFTFSPDSRFLLFTAVPEKEEAWSTNHDICRVPVAGGNEQWECLTRDNPAADATPVFSRDGSRVAYRAQQKPGYEADRWQIMVVETDSSGAFRGKPRSVTASFDGSADSYVWAGDSRSIFFTTEDQGQVRLAAVTGDRCALVPSKHPGSLGALSISAQASHLAFTVASFGSPPEVKVLRSEPAKQPVTGTQFVGQFQDLTSHNRQLLAGLDLGRLESVTVPGAGGTPMQMWIIKPPGFDEKKKWPLVYLVHGGPQSAWNDNWSYRWNPMVWAAQGYVVALPNPRGSTGFGQKYVDEISGDWGGKCFQDLMAGMDYLEKLPYIDRERLAAAGGSFGGYMMNWFQGNTTRFKTLITHCSVYNNDSMYATTDELWFDEWDHGGGKPLWEAREHYLKDSPHLKARNFKTPMLIIHNDLDYRCPVSEGHQLFATLQRLGVPSRFVNFPDEGHWVLKPKNSEYWHKEIFAWLKKYAPPGGK